MVVLAQLAMDREPIHGIASLFAIQMLPHASAKIPLPTVFHTYVYRFIAITGSQVGLCCMRLISCHMKVAGTGWAYPV